MIITFVLFHLLTFMTLCVSTDVSTKNNPCLKLDSCHSKTTSKTCSCDSDCHIYGTCCQDMKKTLQNDSGFLCYSRRPILSPVFAKRSCSDDHRGHTSNELACMDDNEDVMDVGNNLLVTSRRTKITYWSKHCAFCNNEVSSDLEFWNIEVFCPLREEVDGSLIRTNLTFNKDKNQWGLVIADKFLECVVRYAPPFSISEVKRCTPSVISSCPADYNNEAVSGKCSQFYAERKVKNSRFHYKNIYCAICNNASLKHLECSARPSAEEDVSDDFGEMVKEVFTDGEWLEREPGKRFLCSEGFIYDPAREKCRSNEIRVDMTTLEPNSARDNRKETLVLLGSLITLFLH